MAKPRSEYDAKTMWWRGAIIGALVGTWIAVGVAWGVTAALRYGFFVLLACAIAAGSIIASGLTQRWGAWHYGRQLRGHQRR